MYALSEKYKLSFPTTHKYVLICKRREDPQLFTKNMPVLK